MKEQILPQLPIVGFLKLSSRDERRLCNIEVVAGGADHNLSPFFQDCHQKFLSFLSGNDRQIEIPLDYSGIAEFQLQVLEAMAKIPYGQVQSYKDLAGVIKSKAYQAIGSACGRNPFLLIYPCHRVVGSSNIGGFAHGVEMKLALLELETRHCPTPILKKELTNSSCR